MFVDEILITIVDNTSMIQRIFKVGTDDNSFAFTFIVEMTMLC